MATKARTPVRRGHGPPWPKHSRFRIARDIGAARGLAVHPGERVLLRIAGWLLGLLLNIGDRADHRPLGIGQHGEAPNRRDVRRRA